MKKIAVVTALMMALILGVSVKPASAWHGHHYHHGYGNFWGGFAAGTATGLVFGTLAAPRYYEPAPVYVYPTPVCRDIQTPGFWRQIPVTDAGGFTSYQSVWVPGSFQRVCQ